MTGPATRPAALLPAAALLLNAMVWGLSWWPFRYLSAHGVHPLWATALMFGLAVACLLAVQPEAWRGFLEHRWLWLLVLASGLSNVGFNWAVTIGDVVRVVLLFYLMPAWTVLLAWLVLGERVNGAGLLRVAIALVGVVIVMGVEGSPIPVPEGAADWLALLGGFSFALTNVLLRKLRETPGASRALAMFGGGGLLAGLVAAAAMAQGTVQALPPIAADWLLVGSLLSASFLAGNLALQYGAARLSAHTGALLMLSEVLWASASSTLLGAAEMSGRILLGGGLIVLAAALSALSDEG